MAAAANNYSCTLFLSILKCAASPSFQQAFRAKQSKEVKDCDCRCCLWQKQNSFCASASLPHSSRWPYTYHHHHHHQFSTKVQLEAGESFPLSLSRFCSNPALHSLSSAEVVRARQTSTCADLVLLFLMMVLVMMIPLLRIGETVCVCACLCERVCCAI